MKGFGYKKGMIREIEKFLGFNSLYLIDSIATGGRDIPGWFPLYNLRRKIAQLHPILYALMWNDWRYI